jgi:hypothetical protein
MSNGKCAKNDLVILEKESGPGVFLPGMGGLFVKKSSFTLFSQKMRCPMREQKHSKSQSDDRLVCEIDLSSDSGLKELKTMVKDSKFVCRDCGRSAASEERLCEPEWIY